MVQNYLELQYPFYSYLFIFNLTETALDIVSSLSHIENKSIYNIFGTFISRNFLRLKTKVFKLDFYV